MGRSAVPIIPGPVEDVLISIGSNRELWKFQEKRLRTDYEIRCNNCLIMVDVMLRH